MLMVYFLVAIPHHFVVYAVIDECHNGNGLRHSDLGSNQQISGRGSDRRMRGIMLI